VLLVSLVSFPKQFFFFVYPLGDHPTAASKFLCFNFLGFVSELKIC
jgi:hypothetical protein